MLLAIRHYLESHRSALRQTILNLKATPLVTLLSAALITVALSLPGILLALLQNVQGLALKLEQPASISAYVAPHTSAATINELSDEISAMAGVDQVRIVSAHDSLNYFKDQYGMEQSLALFDKNPFPAVIEISAELEHSRGMALDTLLFNVKQKKLIERVETNVLWLERMNALMTFIGTLVWLLVILFASAAILMISSMMLTEITRRLDEIKILRLLGATEIFIRRPFLYTAWIYGFIGGVCATLAIAIVGTLVHAKLQRLVILYHGESLPELNYFIIAVATLASAIVICLASVAIALIRQKKKLLYI
ncbi:MAG: FtsX-like permease family protein [Gammaproteobacteria bacterium]|nr:FtsX-like permease family protein [Gammaproteobacteria bacterium]